MVITYIVCRYDWKVKKFHFCTTHFNTCQMPSSNKLYRIICGAFGRSLMLTFDWIACWVEWMEKTVERESVNWRTASSGQDFQLSGGINALFLRASTWRLWQFLYKCFPVTNNSAFISCTWTFMWTTFLCTLKLLRITSPSLSLQS